MIALRKWQSGVALLLVFLALPGCAVPVNYPVHPSSELTATAECNQDVVVISHYPKQTVNVTLPLPELRLVVVKDNQPHLVQLIDPASKKPITGSYPLWSPDRKTIAFGHVSNPRAGKWKPALVRCDGSGLTVLDHEYLILGSSGSWSADGSKLFVCAPTEYSGSAVFGTAQPSKLKIDEYDATSRKIERSILIKEHAGVKIEPVVSPSGTRIAYADKEDHLFLLDGASQSETDVTPELVTLLKTQGEGAPVIHALDWSSDNLLFVAANRSVMVYDCQERLGRVFFKASSEVVRLRYLPSQSRLLVGYAFQKGIDITQVVWGEASGIGAGVAQVQALPPMLASTSIMVASAGTAALITLPFAIADAKYFDAALALVELDGRVVHSFGVFRNRGDQPALIGTVSSKGRYVAIFVYDKGTHLLDLETGKVYPAVAS